MSVKEKCYKCEDVNLCNDCEIIILKIENKNHDFDYVFKIHFYMLINSGHSNLSSF